MLDQLLEFVINHYILVGAFIFLLALFFRNESQQGGTTVSPSELVKLINREDALVVDLRDDKEFRAGHIVDSINVPYARVEERIGDMEKYREKPVVVVCKMGQQSGPAGKKLRANGFLDVRRLTGGIAEWRAANLPLVK